MSLRIRSAIAIAAAVATALAGFAWTHATRAEASSGTLGPGLVTVNVDVHYSKFSIERLHVREGTTVRFLIHNNDPIHHEFIVGDASVHARHEQGSESAHPPVPGEVSVDAGAVGETFYRFDHAGRFLFACHLPGHLAFGMRGWVIVDPA
jgi:uncharacterized cupredoxin-like copper-binding protein